MEFVWVATCAALSLGLYAALRRTLRVPALLRVNYAGREVPTAGGVVAVGAFILTVAALAVADGELSSGVLRCVVVVVGFAFVGLVDDVLGSHAARGLRGHVDAARKGQLTSGAAKLAVGIAVAVVATVPFVQGAQRQWLEVILVAAAANVANLFDLAPARATKVAWLALVPLLVMFRPAETLVGPACFAAAVGALVVWELREDVMLGDTGANALGAATGLAFALAAGGRASWLWPAVIVVVGLNVAAEVVSFSRVIDRVPPLRALDRLGRRR